MTHAKFGSEDDEASSSQVPANLDLALIDILHAHAV